MTVGELYQIVKEKHWSKRRFQESGWAREVDGYWTRHLAPVFGHIPCNKLGLKEIYAWRDGLEETMPVTANRCLEVLSKMFRFAEQRELLPRGSNPCTLIESLPEPKRSRVPDEEELRRLGEALRRRMQSHPRQTRFIFVLGLTGARPRALQRLRRSDLRYLPDGSAIATFSGKMTKDTGEQDVIVFPRQAVELINSMGSDHDFVFGEIKYRRLWDDVRREADCLDLWLRDFRRGFASVGLSNGHNIDAIGELLNHRSSETTKRYAKLLSSARVKSATAIGGQMSRLLGVT